MKENIIDKILSSSGYLPPRNEEEMSAFEKIYSKVEIDESFHVDVESIVTISQRSIQSLLERVRCRSMISELLHEILRVCQRR